jgi:hypothetical protein
MCNILLSNVHEFTIHYINHLYFLTISIYFTIFLFLSVKTYLSSLYVPILSCSALRRHKQLSYTALNGRMIDECWIGIYFDGSDFCLSETISRNLMEELRKLKKKLNISYFPPCSLLLFFVLVIIKLLSYAVV